MRKDTLCGGYNLNKKILKRRRVILVLQFPILRSDPENPPKYPFFLNSAYEYPRMANRFLPPLKKYLNHQKCSHLHLSSGPFGLPHPIRDSQRQLRYLTFHTFTRPPCTYFHPLLPILGPGRRLLNLFRYNPRPILYPNILTPGLTSLLTIPRRLPPPQRPSPQRRAFG